MIDWPPPFKYALPGQPAMVRRSLWTVEQLIPVEWDASLNNQTDIILTATAGAYGSDFGKRLAKRNAR